MHIFTPMITCTRTNSENKDFRELVRHLDAELKIRDGEEHTFYDQFNKIDSLQYTLVAYEDSVPVGSGAIKPYADGIMEVKRMFVPESHRGRGIASFMLKELEAWALELRCRSCMLETGRNQPEALALYYKNGYQVIPNYGQYANVENSVCFEKILKS